MSRHRRHRNRRSTPAPPSGPAPSARELACLGVLVLVTFAAYWPCLHGGLLWDDDAHVTKPELQSVAGLFRIWFDVGATQQYYPLLHSLFWFEHTLWGDATLGYHVVNVLLHATAACLVFLILKKLKIPGALLAAAIFALHPVQVESVAWITEQKNTLSAVFYLSAMLVYLRFDETRRSSLYAAAMALFVLGLLSKTVTATLPAALLVIVWWQRGRIDWKRDVLPLVPFFVLGAVAGMFTAWVERTLIGAEGADFELSFVQRGLLAGRAIWFYLGKLVWPANLMFVYPRWKIDPSVWWQWLFPIATIVMLGVLWALRTKWRGPLAGWLLFVGTLVPVLGFLNVYPFLFSFVADHFQYLASVGIIVLAAAGITLAMARQADSARPLGISACLLLLGTFAALTWRQCHLYTDSIGLYQATLEQNPDCWMLHNNLGREFAAQGRHKDAMDQFQEAIRLKPDYAESHNNIGAAFAEAGQYAEAIEHYHKALELQQNYHEVHINLGNAFFNTGRLPDAIDEFKIAVRQRPNDPMALQSLGNALAQTDQVAEGIESMERAIRLKPDYAEAHNNLGIALARIGKIPESLAQFRLALQFKPEYADAQNNIGNVLNATGATEEAITHLEQAIRLRPNMVDAHNNLGNAFRKIGRLDEAIKQFQITLRLSPDFLMGYSNLAQTLRQAGRAAEATAVAQQAIAIARSSGNDAAARQIGKWLDNYPTNVPRGNGDAPLPKESNATE